MLYSMDLKWIFYLVLWAMPRRITLGTFSAVRINNKILFLKITR